MDTVWTVLSVSARLLLGPPRLLLIGSVWRSSVLWSGWRGGGGGSALVQRDAMDLCSPHGGSKASRTSFTTDALHKLVIHVTLEIQLGPEKCGGPEALARDPSRGRSLRRSLSRDPRLGQRSATPAEKKTNRPVKEVLAGPW